MKISQNRPNVASVEPRESDLLSPTNKLKAFGRSADIQELHNEKWHHFDEIHIFWIVSKSWTQVVAKNSFAFLFLKVFSFEE